MRKNIVNSIPKENLPKIIGIFKDTFVSYNNKPKEMNIEEWVANELAKYPDIYTKESAKEEAKEIVTLNKSFANAKEELNNHLSKGNSVESYIIKELEKGAKQANEVNVAKYVQDIEESIQKANEQQLGVFYTQNGNINQNPNLDGFIAESHHVTSFNLEATLNKSEYRAEMLQSNTKNSVDIVIRDRNNNIVRKYSVKYGKDAKTTQNYFKEKDYRGQRKLVPSDQVDDIKNSSATIESPDGKIKSTPLSKEEAKRIQKEIQEQKDLQEYNWDRVEKLKIAKHIAKDISTNIAISSGIDIAIRGGRLLWQKLKGEDVSLDNVKREFKDWFNSTIDKVKDISVKSVVTTATTIVVRKGLIPFFAKNTPIGKLASIVSVGVENAKTLYQMATGKIGIKEGFKKMANTTAETIGGLVGAGKGATLGATIGSVLGPIGTAVGGAVGGIAGSIAGSKVGQAVVKGVKKVYTKTTEVVKKTYEKTKSIAKTVANGIKKVGDAVASGVKKVWNWLFS